MSEPLSEAKLAEIKARADDEWLFADCGIAERDIPLLLSEIERLKGEVEAWKERYEDAKAWIHAGSNPEE